MFVVITLIMSKAPNLNSSGDRWKFLELPGSQWPSAQKDSRVRAAHLAEARSDAFSGE